LKRNCVLKMGSKRVPSIALFLSLNLLLFSMVSCNTLSAAAPPPATCPDLEVCTRFYGPPFLPDPYCCPLLDALTDLDAAVCVCSFIKLTFGIKHYDLDVFVNPLLRACHRKDHTYHCISDWEHTYVHVSPSSCCWLPCFFWI